MASAEMAFDEYLSVDDRRQRLSDDSVAHQVIAEVSREIRTRYVADAGA